MSLPELAAAARLHANNLKADIRNQTDRIHHMTATRLAIEADTLASALESAAHIVQSQDDDSNS